MKILWVLWVLSVHPQRLRRTFCRRSTWTGSGQEWQYFGPQLKTGDTVITYGRTRLEAR